MKRLVLYLIVGIASILTQTSILPLLFGLTLRPDLILLLVLYIGLNETPLAGAFYAWLLGCILDVFCGTTLGLNGMIMLLIFCSIYIGRRQLNLKNDLVLPSTLLSLLRARSHYNKRKTSNQGLKIWH
ncbi:MAG: rod shape-determining protein MreD [Desulfobacteraceae bacterium 4572_35.2]|nr:MAG: rod shape-determining protein MreD [Desulfobacteraceae bacterium 4572_35.2]